MMRKNTNFSTRYSKKAMGINQMFIMAASVIVMGLVIFFGIQAIGKVQTDSCSIEYVDVITHIEQRVDDVSRDFGSRNTLDVTLPCQATQLCIVDLNIEGTDFENTLTILEQQSPLAGQAYADKTANVFILKDKTFVGAPQKMDAITIDSPYIICTKQKTSTLSFEGIGKKAKVGIWNPN